MNITGLGYREIAERYNLGSLMRGGDLQITPDGDLAVTLDGDLKLGNDQHNALHRLVVRWQFNAPMLKTMLDFVVEANRMRQNCEAQLSDVASKLVSDRDGALEVWHELHHEIGIHAYGPEACAGAAVVVLNNLLRREWIDLGKPPSWNSAGASIGGRAFGPIVEAAASNFRHSHEWARFATPTNQQMRSIEVLADVLQVTLQPAGASHPFRGNICPEILLKISDESFEVLMDRCFGFARALAGL